jgi:hypothetical protein
MLVDIDVKIEAKKITILYIQEKIDSLKKEIESLEENEEIEHWKKSSRQVSSYENLTFLFEKQTEVQNELNALFVQKIGEMTC